jgi:uncharacterized membrane protein
MNVFWESVYGLGLWELDRTVGISIESSSTAVGVFAWPIVVSGLVFIFSLKLTQPRYSKLRSAAVIALVASSFLVINAERAFYPPYSNLPTFLRLFFVVW